MTGPLRLRKAATQRLRSLGFDERWLQNQIMTDPSLLGLGDLTVMQRERIQSSGGRLDFLMTDQASGTRYEIELMLGATNESHIIRTIEYWDIERQRYPSYEHRAVIVAEEITGRFFNVIRLLNRAVPIIAIQLSAFQIDQEVVLQFIQVLDTADLGDDPEDEIQTEIVNRSFWELNARPVFLATVDSVKALLTSANAEPKITYNKWHVALGTTGYNFVWFYSRKVAQYCVLNVKVPLEERPALIEHLQKSGLEAESTGRSGIRLNLKPEDVESHKKELQQLFARAEEWSHR